MDELFLLPSAPVAVPRAYWMTDRHALTTAVMLVEPSASEYSRINGAIQHRGGGDFDMDIINQLYADTCLIIPHYRYILLTGEFRTDKHAPYLGSPLREWDAETELDETKFVHFSDWPYPKPWITPEDEQRAEVEPKCVRVEGDGDDKCTGSEIWYALYDEFRERRLRVCGAALSRPLASGFG